MQDLIDPIFQSNKDFNNAFASGLDKILENDELGVFILVLANAIYDENIWRELKPKLIKKFEHLKTKELSGAADDIEVFQKLSVINLDDLNTTQIKQIGEFELQYNPLRALRPKRMSNVVTKGMSQNFDANSFNFNKDFLQKEMFYKGKFFGKQISIFYNKFPFANQHGLVVVEPEKQHPQLLTYELHQFAWMMANAIGLSIKGFTLAYNSYGAYASVNHFHLQCFVRNTPLPIESVEKYVLVNHWFGSVNDAWEFIEALHRDEQPYNLIYRENKILIIVRKRQDDYKHSDWTAGYAWYEACGGVSLSSINNFNNLEKQDLKAELEKLKVE